MTVSGFKQYQIRLAQAEKSCLMSPRLVVKVVTYRTKGPRFESLIFLNGFSLLRCEVVGKGKAENLQKVGAQRTLVSVKFTWTNCLRSLCNWMIPSVNKMIFFQKISAKYVYLFNNCCLRFQCACVRCKLEFYLFRNERYLSTTALAHLKKLRL